MPRFSRTSCEAAVFEGGGKAAPFHRNLRLILDLFWPGLSFDQQLQRTWFTDAVLCSARVSGGAVDALVEAERRTRYLVPQIEALENAFVVALGGKAARRMKEGGLRVNATAQHPSARPNTNPVGSWHLAANDFRLWLASRT